MPNHYGAEAPCQNQSKDFSKRESEGGEKKQQLEKTRKLTIQEYRYSCAGSQLESKRMHTLKGRFNQQRIVPGPTYTTEPISMERRLEDKFLKKRREVKKGH